MRKFGIVAVRNESLTMYSAPSKINSLAFKMSRDFVTAKYDNVSFR